MRIESCSIIKRGLIRKPSQQREKCCNHAHWFLCPVRSHHCQRKKNEIANQPGLSCLTLGGILTSQISVLFLFLFLPLNPLIIPFLDFERRRKRKRKMTKSVRPFPFPSPLEIQKWTYPNAFFEHDGKRLSFSRPQFDNGRLTAQVEISDAQ